MAVFSQTDKSAIRGGVTDQSGAIVPNVVTVATETSTNVRARAVTSDENGNYEMADLKPGTYRLTADAPVSAFMRKCRSR